MDRILMYSYFITYSCAPILIFLIGGIVGEPAIILFSFLAAYGLISIYTVLVFSFIGVILDDLFWFWLIRSKFAKFVRKWKMGSKKYKTIELKIESISKKSVFLMLLISKYVFGARIAIIFYMGLKKIKYKEFLYKNLAATSLWLLSIMAIGWFAGRGSVFLIKAFKNFQIGIFILIFLGISFVIINRFFKKKIMKKKVKMIR